MPVFKHITVDDMYNYKRHWYYYLIDSLHSIQGDVLSWQPYLEHDITEGGGGTAGGDL